MAPLAEWRTFSLEQARNGVAEADLAEMLFTRLRDDDELGRAAHYEMSRRQAADACAVAVKPSGRSQRAPAPIAPSQLRLALGDMAPLDGLAADRRYFNHYRATISRYRAVAERLAVIEPYAAGHDLSIYSTYAAALRAAGANETMIADLSA